MKALVVYYSLSGNTEKVALRIAKQLSADSEAITEIRPRLGGFALLRCIWEVFTGARPTIEPMQHAPADYDVVIAGCPVWAQHMASPMRTFLTRHGRDIRQIALFCTYGGVGGPRVLKKMSGLVDCPTVAQLSVTEDDLKAERERAAVGVFVGQVRKAARGHR